MGRVMIAGATGYLGRFLCAEYQRRGWQVTALVRSSASGAKLCADTTVTAEATQPETLKGVMQGVDLVVSALGITRQTDGLSYWDVDFQANLNLLDAALESGVQHFGYVHVLNADRMADVPLVARQARLCPHPASRKYRQHGHRAIGVFLRHGGFSPHGPERQGLAVW